MIDIKDLNKEWYKSGEVAKMLGVVPKTILNYKDAGLIIMRLDEDTNRWYLSKAELIKLLRKKDLLYEEEVLKLPVIYARVSSNDQKVKGDLDRQIEKLENYCKKCGDFSYTIYSDVGSGLNAKRSGLNKLIDHVMMNSVSIVYVTYRDRLTRFGFEYLAKFFKYFGTEIVVIDDIDDKSVQEELVDDMISLVASFSGRLHGMRSSKKKKVMEYLDSIEEEK